MADTQYGVNHPLAVKVWRKRLHQEALKETWFSKFMGESDNSLCQIVTELSKDAGDKVTYGLRMNLTGDGVDGDNTLEGNEEALVTHSDSIYINQLRHAVRSDGKMSEQRVPFSMREGAKDGLKTWWAERYDVSFFNQLCGNTAQTNTKFTGHNATIAPTSTRWIFADDNASETTLTNTASDLFNLKLIDKAVATAKTATPAIRPIRVNGGSYYVMFLDTWQVKHMRTSTDTGQWLDITKAQLSGNGSKENNIFTGALGMYNGVVLHETTRLYTPTSGGGTRCARAVLCGAQAITLAYGKGFDGDQMSWKEDVFDYGNKLGVSAGAIYGIKKSVFNSTDFATIAVSTAAPAE